MTPLTRALKTCPICGAVFRDLGPRYKRISCSLKCSHSLGSRKKEADRTARFFGNVSKGSGCWEWTAGRSGSGYGRFAVAGKVVQAHRFSYELHVGPIPTGLFVCHRCDNPPCVNPAHLFLGTPADNSRDCALKGRAKGVSRPGERASGAKLTDGVVMALREDRAKGMELRELGMKYGVTDSTVAKAAKGRTWKHLPSRYATAEPS